MAENIDAERPENYSPEDRAFYDFWYGHMSGDVMQAPLSDVADSTARYIWDAARTPSASIGEDELPELPEGDEAGMFTGSCIVYTADQMRQFRAEGIAADRRARRNTQLTDAELAEPEYMRAYMAELQEMVIEARNARLAASVTQAAQYAKPWPVVPQRFHDWWNADRLTQTNPFREDSPAYWAWEGWTAATASEESPQAAQGVKLAELVRAADAVVERWHSRDWKQPHTAEFINRLAAAVGALKFAAPPLSSGQQAEKGENDGNQ